MRTRTITSVALIAAFLVWAAPAEAQEQEWGEQEHHGEGHQEAGQPAAEHAEGHGGHLAAGEGLPADAINWADFSYASEPPVVVPGGEVKLGPPIAANVINFILLLVIIYLLARKPITAFLQGRSDTVRDQLKEARRMLDEASSQLGEYSTKLERMDDEMSRLRDEFIAAGESEKERLITEARTKAERMRQDADIRLRQELAQLREELRVEMIEQAITASTALLRAQVKEADQRKLAEDYVERLEREGLGQ